MGFPSRARGASALPEVAGNAALFFSPDSPDEIAAACGRSCRATVAESCEQPAGRERRASPGTASAEETLAVYEKALAR